MAKTKKKGFGGMLVIVLAFGLVLVGCGDGAGGGNNNGGDKKAALKGTWVKDGGSSFEKIEYAGGGGSNDPLYFRVGTAGGAVYYGQMVSYDGTTAKVGDDHSAYTPITFTAKISSGKLTISGLGTVDGIDLSAFNGTYTKEGSGNTSQNPFKGTWKRADANWKLVFTDTTFDYNEPGEETFGTYTYSGNTAVLTEGAGSDHPGDTHTLTNNSNTFTWFWFTFTKL
jgi:hypothetical protein